MPHCGVFKRKLKEDNGHKVSAFFMNTHPSPLDSHERGVNCYRMTLWSCFCYYGYVTARFLSRAPLIGQQHWISIHIDNAIASFSVLLICIMSTVFDCLWSCFLSWNILKFILPFVLIPFSFLPPPSLCFLSLYFAPLLFLLLLPQLMTTNTQMVSLSPSLSALSVFHAFLVPVVPFKLSVWPFHPVSSFTSSMHFHLNV